MSTQTATMVQQQTQYSSQDPTTVASPTHGRSRQTNSTNISPTSTINSANTNLTTPNTSPTSTKSFLAHVPRQLHPPKSPLYRPAALRTTEWAKQSQLNSKNSAESSGSNLDPVLEDEVGNSDDCTGPPKRGHWKPDAEALVCDAQFCNKTFTFLERRHHCRRCGKVFCGAHSSHAIPLDQNCRFNTRGYESRACDSCNKEYKRVCAIVKNSRTSSNCSEETANANVPTSPISGTCRGRDNGGAMGGLKNKIGSYVGSVPRDWSWSTF